MIEPAVIFVRLMEYLGAAVLFGSSLFCLYSGAAGQTAPARFRPVLAMSAAVLALASLLAIGLQASLFSGSFASGFTREGFSAVASSMDLGKAALVRSGAAALALLILLIAPLRRWTLLLVAGLGSVTTGSLAWMGHGAASASWIQLTADVLHCLAAGLWIGALVSFVLLLRHAHGLAELRDVKNALARFSIIGITLVIVLAVSGTLNAWFLVGLDIRGAIETPYGQLLALKLLVFAGMLTLAALHRSRAVPRLGQTIAEGTQDRSVTRALRRTILLETMLGVAVLAVVAWLGTLEPPLVP